MYIFIIFESFKEKFQYIFLYIIFTDLQTSKFTGNDGKRRIFEPRKIKKNSFALLLFMSFLETLLTYKSKVKE